MRIKAIILTVLILLFLIVLLQNTKSVTFQLLFWKISASLIVLLILMLVLGFLIGFILAKLFRRKQKSSKIE